MPTSPPPPPSRPRVADSADRGPPSGPTLPDAKGGRLAITGATVVELYPARAERADVLVEDGVVTQVGGAIPEGVARLDASGCYVMPAFCNAHTHLYMSLTRGMPPPPSRPMTLADTLQWVWWSVDKALDDELVEVSALVGAAQAARAGVACVIDHHSSPRAIDGSLDRIASALDAVGVRGVLCYETSDRDGRGRRDGGLRENERFLNRVRAGKITRHRGMVGAHASMSLNDDTLDRLSDLADQAQVGIHMHVAEDLTDLLDAERRKSTFAARLRRIGLARTGSIAAHAVQLDAATSEEIVRAGGTIVTNARSNMHHGVGVARVSGERIAVGTDGIDQDVFGEARAHVLRHGEARDGLDREIARRVACSQSLASELFGEPAGAPKIAAGRRADLVVLDYDPPTPMTAANLQAHLAYGWRASHVRDLFVGGEPVVQGHKLVRLDEKALMARARAAAERLWERAQGYM